MVDLLRDDVVPQAPVRGISDLVELTDTHAAIHGPVDLEVDPALGEIEQSTGPAVYRLVQESLTNMAKHAHGARSLVRVQLVGGRVLVIVEDDGEGVTTPTPGSYGLVGMRERLVFFGGRVDAGPRPGRGYVVRAEIPVDRP